MDIGTATVLNMIPGGVMPIVSVNQYDTGYQKKFQLYNGGIPFNIASNQSVTIRGTKGDGHGIVNSVQSTVGSNVVTVTITEQMTAVKGAKNVYELRVVNNSGLVIGTANFIMFVECAALNDDTVISDSDLSYANDVYNNLQSVEAYQNLLNMKIQRYDTVAQMKADSALKNGDYARTGGYYAVNDGGTALYRIYNTVPSAHYETLTNGLYAKLITDEIVHPEQFGAVGDGISDDTTIIQAAVDSGKNVVFTKRYLCGTVNIANKENVTYLALSGYIRKRTGTGTLFKYSGNIKNVVFDGFKAYGNNTGVTTSSSVIEDGAFLFCESNPNNNINNVTVKNCHIKDFSVGVSFNADKDGFVKNVSVINCTFEHMTGSNPGYGYGVHIANGSGEYIGAVVSDNHFDNCERHAIYMARGNGCVIKGNVIRNHKKDTHAGIISAAINISRSWNVIVDSNEVYNNTSGCIRVSSSLTNVEDGNIYPLAAYKADNIIIANNILHETDLYAIILGYLDPILGLVGKIKVDNNYCYGAVYVGCAEETTITNNTIIGRENDVNGSPLSAQRAIVIFNRRSHDGQTTTYNASAIIAQNIIGNEVDQPPINITSEAAADRIFVLNNVNNTNSGLINQGGHYLTNLSFIGEKSGLSQYTQYKAISKGNTNILANIVAGGTNISCPLLSDLSLIAFTYYDGRDQGETVHTFGVHDVIDIPTLKRMGSMSFDTPTIGSITITYVDDNTIRCEPSISGNKYVSISFI